MTEKKATFEENMDKLNEIVQELQGGNVPLKKALSEFQNGVKLSQEMQKTLQNADNTLAKMVNSDGDEVPFTRDKGYEELKQQKSDGNEDGAAPF
ncbi:exodeoxyribonuclease VII small subunit [Fructilactobacillus lindneri]|uniref:Exodeoxyribonuclease 7 small subunit n=2 Tax=Fructilactobacillus lindneri TaxID=53444 RepID=A0A0R2JPI6_9LACO|nr:exodeoxyribonuclease VII small subunit [Fructilactobacillus lindneri]ANZ58229.1 exodeoxyribonuclease VII small subunit [Fructilactobacillus lindneri]ANZ59551.1 exodeoxyribonuclease VII small subunit [Fructilactobacillus lindneri]KRN79055.1 hypothetical protein IV52_GL000460 [Fructilactobacillus lindneri DSM 20690 = JCM 11027]POG98665.1 exodeoxyribonuclease VII small subunit [Fructilactobacillus lindneri]POH04053.1 exodeoxyribonuclease VII small subunit [Fructilactobacillus lindneri]